MYILQILSFLEANKYMTFPVSIASNSISDIIAKKYSNYKLREVMKKVVSASTDSINKSVLLDNWNSNSIDDCWNFISDNDELCRLFASELKKDLNLYLYHIDLAVETIQKNQLLLPLLNLDERNSFEDPKSFMRVFPQSKFMVDDLFIEPVYAVKTIKDGDESLLIGGSSNSINVLESCKGILFSNSHILFILGPYGSGKTFLSKQLLFSLTDGFSLYIYANRLPDDFFNFSLAAIEELIEKHKKLYIFLDSCEGYFAKNPSILEDISKLLTRFKSLYFIINLRKPSGVFLKDLYADIELMIGEIKFIELQYFGKNQIKQWLSLYELSSSDLGLTANLTYEDIDRANKNFRSSCKNPLLLAMIAESSSNYLFCKHQNWYNLFNEFIQKTIQGKFKLEKRFNELLKNNTNNYREFIYEVASTILETSVNEINIEKFNNNDFFLDANERLYSIHRDLIEKHVKNILDINADENMTIQYLNCYFFEYEQISNSWKFKDNNILFFLCASKICNSLFELLDKFISGDNVLSNMNKLIDSYRKYPLHPVVIEFILDRISNYERREDLQNLIQYLFENNKIINIPSKESFLIDYNKIKFDILLSIVFLRLNYNYQAELEHFFKRISHYYSFVKIIDKDLASIIRRYFRNLIIYNAEFRRINLKGYNFSNSSIKKSSFIQCKFYDTSMCNLQFNEVYFNLCFMKKMCFDRFKGSINIQICHMLDTTFVIGEESKLQFNNCIIDNVWIKCDDQRIVPLIRFDCCDIRQLHIDCKKIDISISNSHLNSKIHLKNTIVFHKNFGNKELEKTFNGYFHKDANSEILVQGSTKQLPY